MATVHAQLKKMIKSRFISFFNSKAQHIRPGFVTKVITHWYIVVYLNNRSNPRGGSGVVVDKIASSFIVPLLLPAWRQVSWGWKQLLRDWIWLFALLAQAKLLVNIKSVREINYLLAVELNKYTVSEAVILIYVFFLPQGGAKQVW